MLILGTSVFNRLLRPCLNLNTMDDGTCAYDYYLRANADDLSFMYSERVGKPRYKLFLNI